MIEAQPMPHDEIPKEELSPVIRCLMASYFYDTEEEREAAYEAEMQRIREEARKLQVEGGVDAEAVTRLKQFQEAFRDGSDYERDVFETDREGRITLVAINTEWEKRVFLHDVLPHLESLESVVDAYLWESPPPPPVEHRLPDDAMGHLWKWRKLRKLHLSGYDLTGRAFTVLAEQNPLEHLEELEVQMETDTDRVLEAVAGCRKLRQITLSHCDLTDDGVRRLSDLENLTELTLNTTQITGTGFAENQSVAHLVELSLERCPITDEGLAAISRFTKLQSLYGSSPQVTDAGVANLANLEELHTLSLTDSQVTAAGLEALTNLTKLQTLWIRGTSLGDEAVPVLSQFKNLSDLWTKGSRITEAGYAELRKALPMLDLADIDVPDCERDEDDEEE